MKSSNKKGLTLVEILIAMGAAIIVGGLLMVIIVNSAGLYYKQSSNLEGGLNINDALVKVRQSIKLANKIDSISTSEKLVLKISSIDSSNNIIADNFDDFIFTKEQQILRFKVIPSVVSSRKTQDQIFSTNVDKLVFQYFNLANPPVEVSPQNASTVRIALTVKQKTGVSIELNTATSEANLRND